MREILVQQGKAHGWSQSCSDRRVRYTKSKAKQSTYTEQGKVFHSMPDTPHGRVSHLNINAKLFARQGKALDLAE